MEAQSATLREIGFSNHGFWAGLLANTIWASSFVGAKFTLNTWKPFTAGTLRLGLGTLFIFLGMKLLGRSIQRPTCTKDWLLVFLVSLTGFGILYPLLMVGLTMISSGQSACIMLTCPLFIILFGILLLQEAIEYKKILALGIGLVGSIILLLKPGTLQVTGNRFFLGSILTLVAAALFSLSAVLSRIVSRQLDSFSITFWAMLLAFLTMLPMTLAVESADVSSLFVDRTPSAWVALFYLAIFCSAFSYFTWYFALSRALAKELAATMYLKTPVAVFLGVILASETLTSTMTIGASIILFAVWLSQTRVFRLPFSNSRSVLGKSV